MSQASSTVIITIDGPAGAGKSTVAKALAKQLKYSYLDTGAMYRALTLKAINEKVDLKDEKALIAMANNTTIDLAEDENYDFRTYLDGKDVSEEIRSLEVTNNTFYIARAPGVRKIMVQWQRDIGHRKNVVVEGRDVGTVVFPDATKKFYLDANFEERAKRRIKELKEKINNVEDLAIKKDLKDRDTKDINRKAGPLKKADDAIFVDSTKLTVEGVVDKILSFINSHG